jgi:hypothetical protein
LWTGDAFGVEDGEWDERREIKVYVVMSNVDIMSNFLHEGFGFVRIASAWGD